MVKERESEGLKGMKISDKDCGSRMASFAFIFKGIVKVIFDFFFDDMNTRAYSKTRHVFRMLNFNQKMTRNKKKCFLVLESIRIDGFLVCQRRYPIRETGYQFRETGDDQFLPILEKSKNMAESCSMSYY